MRKLQKPMWLLIILGMLAVPLGTAAAAYACGVVATLTTLSGSPPAAAPGSTVTVTGRYYGTYDSSNPSSNGLAQIRLGSLTGPVLASAAPAGNDNSFTVQVTIPADAAPGDTFLAATQKQADGTPVSGTPVREAFTVLAPVPVAPTVTPPAVVMPPAPAVTPPAPVVTPAAATVTPPAVVTSPAPAVTAAGVTAPTHGAKAHKAAIAACKSKYSARRAKTHRGKQKAARRLAACLAQVPAAGTGRARSAELSSLGGLSIPTLQ